MKLTNIRFFATANSKGNSKNSIIKVLMILLVISVSLIPSFTLTVASAVNEYKNDFRARCLELDPWLKELTDDIIDSVRNINHVQEVDMLKGMRSQLFSINQVTDNNGICEEWQKEIEERKAAVQALSLIGSEKMSVIAGKNLNESPSFCCIIPSLFYPFEDTENYNNLEYIDGESLIGKTLTVTANYGEYYETLYNYFDGEQGGNEWIRPAALEYKLKIVGVYYASPTANGYFDSIYVSEETGRLIQETELEEGGYDLNSDKTPVEKWWCTPSLRTHYVIVDDYDNIPYVYNEISKLGLVCADNPELGIKESVLIISKILSVASVILLIAPSILLVIVLIQSTASNLKKRRGEIGLMKALGYSDKNIFFCLCYEQLLLTLKGFFAGGIISVIIIAISNFYNNHSSYVNRLYIVDWSVFLTLLSISLAVSVVIPVACQLIALKRLSKIQPKDAMNNM